MLGAILDDMDDYVETTLRYIFIFIIEMMSLKLVWIY